MDITLNLNFLKDLENGNVKVDAVKFQKMILLFNSIEQGWSIKKRKDFYIFSKPHEGNKEVVEESYLTQFMKSNLDIKNIMT